MDKSKIDLFMSLKDDLNKSRPTMSRYITENSYPPEVCIQVEILTNGEICAVEMRPDVFKATQDQLRLIEICLDSFEQNMEQGCLQPTIGILNFFERQQPSVYDVAIQRIRKMKNGEKFIEERIAHKSNERD